MTAIPVWTGVPVWTGDWFERAFRFTGCAARALLPRRALLTGRSARRPPPQYAPRRGLRSVPPPETLLKAASTLSCSPCAGRFSFAPSPCARSRIPPPCAGRFWRAATGAGGENVPPPCAGRFWRAATGAGGENGSAPVRGAFFHRLRSGSPHGSAPFPCGTLGVGGELQKAAPSAPPPCGTTFSFPRGTGPPAARRRRSPVRRIFTPVPHSFSRAPAFSRRVRIPVLFLDNPRARRL